MRYSKNTSAKIKVIAVWMLSLGFVLTTSTGVLKAQQSVDQASNVPSAPDAGDSAGDVSVPVPQSATKTNTVPATRTLTFDDRLKNYEHSFISPESIVGPALGAAIGQLNNSPQEWGQGAAGYGRRFASGFGRSLIGRTIGFGVAVVDHEDTRFVPSNESGIWRRTVHAVGGTFVSRTDSGGTMPAYSRFAGVYGAAFIANSWEPPSQKTNLEALERGSTALLSSVAWHVFEEFWPDIRHGFHRR